MEFKDLLIQNPWWENKHAIRNDEKVKTALEKKPAFIPSLDLNSHVTVIRGPRQVGKTSLLKLVIHELLIEKNTDPKAIFYFACDPLADKKELIEVINTYFDFAEDIKTHYIFLDEVTFIQDWELGLKYFIDLEKFKNSYLVFTGSSAPELKRGAERMPGRKVKERLLMPLSFRDYVETFSGYSLPTIKMNDLANFTKLKRAVYKIAPQVQEFKKLFNQYLTTGGFLRPIYEFYENKRISEESYQLYIKWIVSDLAKLNKSENIFFQVIKGILERYNTRFGLEAFARETERISSHSVLSAYLELLENLLVTITLYQVDISRKIPRFKKQRKVYFLDPFLYSCFKGYSLGSYKDFSEDAKPALAETNIIMHLARFLNKKRIFTQLWFYSDKQGEVDAVLRIKNKLLPIEVKWQSKVSEQDFKHKKQFNQGILISKDSLNLSGSFLVIPTYLFLPLLNVRALG